MTLYIYGESALFPVNLCENKEVVMKIVIVGCGKVGTSIATELNSEGHEIVVVDINHEAVTRLSESLDIMGIEGNGATYEILVEAGAPSAALGIGAAAREEIHLSTLCADSLSGTIVSNSQPFILKKK